MLTDYRWKNGVGSTKQEVARFQYQVVRTKNQEQRTNNVRTEWEVRSKEGDSYSNLKRPEKASKTT